MKRWSDRNGTRIDKRTGTWKSIHFVHPGPLFISSVERY